MGLCSDGRASSVGEAGGDDFGAATPGCVTEEGQAVSDMTDLGSADQSSTALVLSKRPKAVASGLSDG